MFKFQINDLKPLVQGVKSTTDRFFSGSCSVKRKTFAGEKDMTHL